MKIFKSIFIFTAAVLAAAIISLTASAFVQAQPMIENSVDIYFFWGDGCPHCEKEWGLLKELRKRYPSVKINDFEIWSNKKNLSLLKQVEKELNAKVSGVPFTVVGNKYFNGYLNDKTTGAAIEDAVKKCLKNKCESLSFVNKPDSDIPRETVLPDKLSVPIFGEIKVKNFSLPILTIVIGALDGFNPCAMWTLVFLIGLLLGMENRTRMWILGGAFIAVSAGVYFLFMTAWLNLILFIGFILWVRLGIGVIALGGGAYNLREFFANKEGVCKVTGGERRRKIFERIKQITHEQKFWIALIGIIILAFAVNLVELICSAGLPTVYTQILAMNQLALWQYYLYILLYIFIFMLDDLIVFSVAMMTLQVTGVTTKYVRASHLIGGVLMLLVGVLLIIKPEWLMF